MLHRPSGYDLCYMFTFQPAAFRQSHEPQQPSADAGSKALLDAAAPSKLWAAHEWDHELDADPRAKNDPSEWAMSPAPSR